MRGLHAFAAARRHLDAGPEPYEHLDLRLATKLGGALYLIGVFYALTVLPLSPPNGGTIGWLWVSLILGTAVGTGIFMLRARGLHQDLLLGFVYLGIVMAGLFRAVAGQGSPFHQLLFLCALYAAAVHPASRTFWVLMAVTVAAALPAAYETVGEDFFPMLTAQLSLTWSLGVLTLVWTTRVRALRREVNEARAEADMLARIDPLTGLGNRRALEEALPKEVAAARRAEAPLSVLVADLDEFKTVNDRFGHQAGDDVLRAVARALMSAVRVHDPCFRWGGDEFVALLPGSDLATADDVAGRVAEAVAASCRTPDGEHVRVTTGTAQLDGADTGDDVFARADAVLLEAKLARRAAASH